MRTSSKKGKRMPNSMFGRFCTIINKMPIGTRYTSKQIREQIPTTLKRNQFASYGMSYSVSTFNIMLMATGCVKRIKQGTFEVLGHVPDFVTYSTCAANRGQSRYKNGKYIKDSKWKLGDPPLVIEKKVKVSKPVKTVKRQSKSMFGALCVIINNLPIGTVYTIKELLVHVPQELKDKPMSNYAIRQGGVQHKLASAHSSLISTKCMKRIRHNVFEIVAHIPDFLTLTMTDVNRKYREGQGWVLGDPTPVKEIKPKRVVDIIETEVKPKLILLGQIEGCLRTKGINEAVIAMAEGIGPVHILEIGEKNPEMIHISAEGLVKWIEVIKINGIRIVGSEEYRRILYPNRETFVMHDFGIRDLKSDSYKSESHLSFFKGTDVLEQSVEVDNLVKEAQIVSILKEGLSAVDAAKKIMKLF